MLSRTMTEGVRLLQEAMRMQGERSPYEWFGQGISAGIMYLSLVDAPSVAGGTTPMLAAGQAMAAAGALSHMLI